MTAAHPRWAATLTGATVTFLFVAPFAGSAGLRGAALLVAAIATVVVYHRSLDLASLPRAVLAAFALWSALALASVTWSIQPSYSLGEVRTEILYGAGVLLVFLFAAREAPRWATWRTALLVATLLVAAWHVAQQFTPVAITRHLGDGGLRSTHLVLVAPLVLLLGAPLPWGAGASFAAVAAALLLLAGAAWDTGNRAVWVALAVELGVALALSSRFAPDDGRLRAFRRLLAAAVLAVFVILAGAIGHRAAGYSPGSPVSAVLANDVRPRIWSAAWVHFEEAPWLGHGFGREILEAQLVKTTPPTGNHPPVRHSHNVFLDVALQLGIVGLAVFVALLVALGFEYRAFLRDRRIAPLGVVGLALLAGFVAKNMTDDFLHRHNALVFWALNGMLLGLARARA